MPDHTQEAVTITFTVQGIPKPGGSKRAFVINGRASLTDASGQKGKDWRGDVRNAAALVYKGDPLDCPLGLRVVFTMPRPRSHYRGKTNVLKPNAPFWHGSKPDATKLLRSLEDALTGIIWKDDSRIVRQMVEKVYGDRPGAIVSVVCWPSRTERDEVQELGPTADTGRRA